MAPWWLVIISITALLLLPIGYIIYGKIFARQGILQTGYKLYQDDLAQLTTPIAKYASTYLKKGNTQKEKLPRLAKVALPLIIEHTIGDQANEILEDENNQDPLLLEEKLNETIQEYIQTFIAPLGKFGLPMYIINTIVIIATIAGIIIL